MTPSRSSVSEVVLQDLWVHIGAFLAIAFGAADLWYFHQVARDADLLFLIGGLAAFGVKIVNGSASLLRATASELATRAQSIPPAAPAFPTTGAQPFGAPVPPTATTGTATTGGPGAPPATTGP